MARDAAAGLLAEPTDHTSQVVILLYSGGPALAIRTWTDPATALVNPSATLEPPDSIVCDYSGVRVRAGDKLRRTWDGYNVLAKYWEPRHPQDFVRSRPEATSTTQGNTRPADLFIGSDLPQVTTDDL